MTTQIPEKVTLSEFKGEPGGPLGGRKAELLLQNHPRVPLFPPTFPNPIPTPSAIPSSLMWEDLVQGHSRAGALGSLLALGPQMTLLLEGCEQ